MNIWGQQVVKSAPVVVVLERNRESGLQRPVHHSARRAAGLCTPASGTGRCLALAGGRALGSRVSVGEG